MFYDDFKRECELHGYSMSALLDTVNLSRGNLKRWREGNDPKPSTKILLATTLGLDKDYFINQKQPPSEVDGVALDDIDRSILGAAMQLNDSQKKLVLDMARALAEKESE